MSRTCVRVYGYHRRVITLHVQKLVPGPTMVCTVSYAGCINTARVGGALVEGNEYGRWLVGDREIRLRCRNGGIVAEVKPPGEGQTLVVEPTSSPWQFDSGVGGCHSR